MRDLKTTAAFLTAATMLLTACGTTKDEYEDRDSHNTSTSDKAAEESGDNRGDLSDEPGNESETLDIPKDIPVTDAGEFKYMEDNKLGGIVVTGYTGEQTKIHIPEKIDGKAVVGIGAIAFEFCSSLTSVTIPDGVLKIGEGAFINCTSLTEVNIPDGVNTIFRRAFENCTSLTNIAIPDSVIWLGNGAFYGCTSLTDITYLGETYDYKSFEEFCRM